MSAARIIKPTGPAPKFTDDLQIAYVPGAKKIGTISGDRYQLYCNAKTIGEALKLGSKRADVHWDWEKGYMQVVGPVSAYSGKVAEKPMQKPVSAQKQPKPVTAPQKQAPKPQQQQQQQQAPAPALEKPSEGIKTPQKAQPQAAPASPAKRVRSLALPRVLQRAERLVARAQMQTVAQAGTQAEKLVSTEAAEEALVSDVPSAKQAQATPATEPATTTIDASEGRAEAAQTVQEAQAEQCQQEVAEEQTQETAEPEAKRARTEAQGQQQEAKDEQEENDQDEKLQEDVPEQ